MKYENIEAISANNAELLRRKVASQSTTTKEMLCLEKYYFDRSFLDEVDEEQRGEFWDGGGLPAPRAPCASTASQNVSSAPSFRESPRASTIFWREPRCVARRSMSRRRSQTTSIRQSSGRLKSVFHAINGTAPATIKRSTW